MATEFDQSHAIIPPGERLASAAEVQDFWTEERLGIARRVYFDMHRRLYDLYPKAPIPQFDINNYQRQFILTVTDDKDELVSSGSYHSASGWITLNISDLGNNRWLGEVIAHEVGESRAFRLSRFGEQFAFIDESVIEVTTQRLLYDEWPHLKDDPNPVSYRLAREATSILCKQMFRALPQNFYYPHEVMALLQETIFMDKPQPFLELFTKAYGNTGPQLLQTLASFGLTVYDENIRNSRSGNSVRYAGLLKFLSGEPVNLNSAKQDIAQTIEKYRQSEEEQRQQEIKRQLEFEAKHCTRGVTMVDGKIVGEKFLVNGNIVEIDYTQVPANTPVEDYLENQGVTRWGVRKEINNAMDYMHLSLQGFDGAHFFPLTIGPEPTPKGHYKPTQQHIMSRRVDNAAFALLVEILQVKKQPLTTYMWSRNNTSISYYELYETEFPGEGKAGNKVYLLRRYDTKKKYKSDERIILRDKANVHIKILTPTQVSELITMENL